MAELIGGHSSFQALVRWVREIRSEQFHAVRAGEPIRSHFQRAAIRAGIGEDGYARLFELTRRPDFVDALHAADLPSDLRRKDSVYFVITTKCNNGIAHADDSGEVVYKTCGHCLNGSGPHGVTMTAEEIERVVAHLPHPLREIEISGGEVLHPDVLPRTLQTLRACADRYGDGLMLSLQTNGDFLRHPAHAHDLVQELTKCGLRRLVIASMDVYHGRGATVEEKLEERKRHYARIAENLRRERVLFLRSGEYDRLRIGSKLLAVEFFGADIQHWFQGFIIDDLAPNARAVRSGLVTEQERGVRYCDRHAGGRGFLGSPSDDQVAINGGPVYPCCWFTEFPLGDARADSVPAMLLAYAVDPLALAQHLGQPRRVAEIAEIVSPTVAGELREALAETVSLSECTACRRITATYTRILRAHGYEAYGQLWPNIPVPWNHRTDREFNAVFESWAST